MRPATSAMRARLVEARRRKAELRGISADVVQRNEPVVHVERGVLHTLGHHRGGELLELAREMARRGGERGRARGQVAGEGVADEVEDAHVGPAAVGTRLGDRPLDAVPVLRVDLVVDVGAVDRKRGDHFGERVAQRGEGEIARVAVGARDAREAARDHRELARKRAAQDEAARAARHLGEIGVVAHEAVIGAREARFRRGIHEEAIHHVGEAISRGAMHGPFFRHILERRHDLFHRDIDRAAARLVQALEIFLRIVEPVGVVDAQRLHRAFAHQAHGEAVGRVEDALVLLAERRQFVDVEEAPVVDLVLRHAPVGELVGLRLEKLVQRVEGGGLAGLSVEPRHGALEGGRDLGVAADECREAPLRDFLAEVALVAARAVARAARGQARQCLGDRAQRLRLVRKRLAAVVQLAHREAEDARILARVDRQPVLEVAHREGAARRLVAEDEVARGELDPVVISQHRQQHAVGEMLARRVPVDVEEFRQRRSRAVLEHVLPPRVVGGEHAHVVGHEVHHLRHAVARKLGHEGVEVLAGADLRVEGLVVDDVVAVLAAGARAQVRRAVDVAHAEIGEVGYEARHVAEGELTVQLHAIRGERNAGSLEARRRGAACTRPATQRRQALAQAPEARIAFPVLER